MVIYRTNGINNTTFILIDSTMSLNDTIYNDSKLNTINYQYIYRIDLYSVAPGKRLMVGSTNTATSIFLVIQPSDNQLILSWNINVPWINTKYIIYRKKPNSLQFDSLTWTDKTTYTDKGLANNVEFCYYIKSIGGYSDPGIVHPIINLSQQACTKPIDNVPPCPPNLSVKANCGLFENTLTWSDPNHSCSNDVIKYIIWYSPTDKMDFSILKTTPDFSSIDTTFIHNNLKSIAGCYAIMAIDSFGNKSTYSNIVCVDIDSCSLYKLPNVFTPNNDAFNNLYIPFPYQYVQSIDLKVYNRWGVMVFETKDPAINWDGKDINSKKECSDGVYFYVCLVFEERLKGLSSRTLQGTITTIR